MPYRPIKHLPSIRKIPDELWDEIKIILPPEKPNKTIGRPIISYRKVLDGIVYILTTGCQVENTSKEYGSASSTCHRRFQQWIVSEIFRKL